VATNLRVPTPQPGPISTVKRWPYTPGGVAPFQNAEVVQADPATRVIASGSGSMKATLRWPVTSGATPPFVGIQTPLESNWGPRYQNVIPQALKRLIQVGTFAPFLEDLPEGTRLMSWGPVLPDLQPPRPWNVAPWLRARPDTPFESRISPPMWLPSSPIPVIPRRRAPLSAATAPPFTTTTAPSLTTWLGWEPDRLEGRPYRVALQAALAWFSLIPSAAATSVASYMPQPSRPDRAWAELLRSRAAHDPARWWSPQFAADPLASMWAPTFPARVPGAAPRPRGGAFEPPAETTEAIVLLSMFAPSYPDFLRPAAPRLVGQQVLATLEFGPLLTWSPLYPVMSSPRPYPAALRLRARPDTPFSVQITPGMWGPTYPDFARRAPRVPVGGPVVLPLVTTTAPSIAQWLGYEPDWIRRPSYIVALQPSYLWPTFTPGGPVPSISSYWRPFSEPAASWAAIASRRQWMDSAHWYQPRKPDDPPVTRFLPTYPAFVLGEPPVLFTGETAPPSVTTRAELLSEWLATYPDWIAQRLHPAALQVPWWWFVDTPAAPTPDLPTYYRPFDEPQRAWAPSHHAALAAWLMFGGLPGLRSDRGLIFMRHESVIVVGAQGEIAIVPIARNERGRTGPGG
jgi:hypothetical protein